MVIKIFMPISTTSKMCSQDYSLAPTNGKGCKFCSIDSMTESYTYGFVDRENERYKSIVEEIYTNENSTLDILIVDAATYRIELIKNLGDIIWHPCLLLSGNAVESTIKITKENAPSFIRYLAEYYMGLADLRLLGKLIYFARGSICTYGNNILELCYEDEGVTRKSFKLALQPIEVQAIKEGYDYKNGNVIKHAFIEDIAYLPIASTTDQLTTLSQRVDTIENKIRKENNNMNFSLNNIFKDVKFGRANENFALTFEGKIAFKGKHYDEKSKSLVDNMGMVIDASELIYIMPLQSIAAGDIVCKGTDAFYYDGANFINLVTGEKTEYVPTRIFNMTFYSVVKNMASGMFGKNTNMQNMLPFFLLQNKGNNDNSMLMALMMSQGGFNPFAAANTNTNTKGE